MPMAAHLTAAVVGIVVEAGHPAAATAEGIAKAWVGMAKRIVGLQAAAGLPAAVRMPGAAILRGAVPAVAVEAMAADRVERQAAAGFPAVGSILIMQQTTPAAIAVAAPWAAARVTGATIRKAKAALGMVRGVGAAMGTIQDCVVPFSWTLQAQA
ncbi:hypothetical protein DUT91_23950 [Phyllobacterium salinisoli]|uniref:Uncharacterized protein n=1 Tax=Phyllobacterium salinisoli TaxID=1899321 RepID=A0A368JWD0_9HYPH|nr:hypothetical protein DUT91_23950 [Phyllobacterium salinisoli]